MRNPLRQRRQILRPQPRRQCILILFLNPTPLNRRTFIRRLKAKRVIHQHPVLIHHRTHLPLKTSLTTSQPRTQRALTHRRSTTLTRHPQRSPQQRRRLLIRRQFRQRSLPQSRRRIHSRQQMRPHVAMHHIRLSPILLWHQNQYPLSHLIQRHLQIVTALFYPNQISLEHLPARRSFSDDGGREKRGRHNWEK